MGDVLGGLSDTSIDAPEYKEAIDRVIALATQAPIALTCSEGDARNCHRSWTVGAALLVHHSIAMTNILRDGSEESVTATLLRTRAADIPELVRDDALRISREAAKRN
jgi:hypothetical protein